MVVIIDLIVRIIIFSFFFPQEINICKFSECGTRVAVSSLYGEIIVWDVESKNVIGYLKHEQNIKITALVWHIDHSNEIAFCDALGKLGCIDVVRKLFHVLRIYWHFIN